MPLPFALRPLKKLVTLANIIQNARKRITDDAGKIQLTSLEYSMFVSLIRSAYDAFSISNDNAYLELAFQNVGFDYRK